MLTIILSVIVGITCSGMKAETRDYYKKCIEDAGAELVIFDNYAHSIEEAEAMVATVDAIIVPGKTKKDTLHRYNYDKLMIEAARKAGKPMLGICLGHQNINKYFGGKTSKNEELAPGSDVCHKKVVDGYNVTLNSKCHSIDVEKDSNFYKIMGGKKKLQVNSSHFWSVDRLGEGLTIVARADDGIVEAFEGDKVLGVQFHPEVLYGKMHVKQYLKIFQWLVNTAK